MPIASVSAGQVRAFFRTLKLGSRSQDNFLGSIKTLFEFAKGRGYLPRDHDELNSVEFIDEGAGEIEIFTPEEMARMIQATPSDFRPSLAIAAFSGIRSAEIKRLDWSDVNLGNGEPFIKVVAAKAKTGSHGIVPILPRCSSESTDSVLAARPRVE